MGDSTPPPAKVIPKWHKPISLQEMRLVIRYEMGWKSLRNYLEAVEMEKRRPIIRRTRRRHRTVHLVTLSAVARWAPEIVPPDVMGDREATGLPNDGASMRAVAQLLAKRDDHMAETARNIFEARIKPYARDIAGIKLQLSSKSAESR